jgi:tripartite-type tricarboxylate transporter receptor subunit TctC
MIRSVLGLLLLSSLGLGQIAFLSGSARADSVADFYRGKTITIQVGYGSGGGFDLTARLVAQFYGKHIPGQPNVVVENVPGGGSLKVMNTIYNVAPRDGLTLALFLGSNVMEPLYGDKLAQFDARKFSWIGNMDTDQQACGVWKGAGVGIKTLADLIRSKKTVTFGSTAPNAGLSVFPMFFKNVLGAPVKVVNGYQGTKDVELAMRRGEVDAYCGFFESTVRASYQQDIASGDLNLFVQLGLDRKSEVFGNATPISEFLTTDEMRQMAEIIFGPALLTRPLVGPPGVPPERLEALRKGLTETLQDPALLARAKKAQMMLKPMNGEEAEKLVARLLSTPPALAKKAYGLTHEK